MGHFDRFEIVEDNDGHYLAVMELDGDACCAIEGREDGRYLPVVYGTSGTRVAMGEPCRRPEVAADVCIELAQVYYRLLAQAAGGPRPDAEWLEVAVH